MWLFIRPLTPQAVVTPVEGDMLTDVVALQAVHRRPISQPVSTASTLAGDSAGIIDIRVSTTGPTPSGPRTGAATTANFITRCPHAR